MPIWLWGNVKSTCPCHKLATMISNYIWLNGIFKNIFLFKIYKIKIFGFLIFNISILKFKKIKKINIAKQIHYSFFKKINLKNIQKQK